MASGRDAPVGTVRPPIVGRLHVALPARCARCRPVQQHAAAPPPYDRAPLPENPLPNLLQMRLLLSSMMMLLLPLHLMPLTWMRAAAAPRPYDRTPLPENPYTKPLRMKLLPPM